MFNAAQKAAMKHPNSLGAGAEKRNALPAKDKFAVVMKEGYRGTLHSGNGKIVTKPAQMKAIAASESGMPRSHTTNLKGYLSAPKKLAM